MEPEDMKIAIQDAAESVELLIANAGVCVESRHLVSLFVRLVCMATEDPSERAYDGLVRLSSESRLVVSRVRQRCQEATTRIMRRTTT